MKLKIIFLLLLINIITLKAQISFSQEDIDVFISYLDSTNIGDISGVVSNLIEANVSQALPKIEQNFWDHNCHTQQWLLKAMYKFNSQFTQEYCYALLDSLNKPQKEKYDPNEKYNGYDCIDILSAKVSCIEILYKLGDFSRVDEVFEMVERDKLNGTSFSNAAILLPYIFKNRPDIKDQAKQEMLDAIADTEDDFAVFAYSLTLTQAFGEEEIPEMVQLFKTITNPQAKRGLLEFYFSKYEDKFDLDGLVKETLLTEQNQELRLYLSKVLILGFATPSDYVFLTNYIQSEPSDTIKSLIQLEIDAFRPPLPDSMNSTNDLLNNLYNYVDSVSNYTWLGDLQFKNQLQSIIQSAKSELQAGDSVACAIQVKAFQDNVDFVYKDSLNTDPRFVTLEGWKFLYWNAQYILDRLPTPPPVVEINLTEITPAMSMKNQPGAFTIELNGSGYTSSSIVYFNGQARATTFVSDSTLNAAILSSDVSVAGNFPVWISDGTTNSDTLVYKVVNNLPNQIIPIMNCVTNNGNGTYTAYFGYDNQNSAGVFIPIYSQNKISPDPWDRGQPGVFKVGVWEKVFSVTWTSGNIIWHLNNKIATAKRTSPACQ